jgi:hypothetical protein
VVEIGADHQMGIVELAGHEPAVVPPLGESFHRGAANAGQGPGHPGYISDLHRD